MAAREVAANVSDRVAIDTASQGFRERQRERGRVGGSSRVERDSSRGSPRNRRSSRRNESAEAESDDSERLVARRRHRSRDRRGAR